MLFRVTFSNDVDEYYKEVPKDIRLSMTLDAKSFKSAELQANQTLTLLLFWPGPYEVVSIDRIDVPIEEELEKVEHVHVWKVYNGFYVCANKCGKRLPYDKFFEEWKDYDVNKSVEFTSNEPVKKVPEIWCLDTGIQILDPDGWDRKDPDSWYVPITRTDFIKRAMKSTCDRWPEPLFDDDYEETTDIYRKRPY